MYNFFHLATTSQVLDIQGWALCPIGDTSKYFELSAVFILAHPNQLSPAYILTISSRFTVAPPVFTQRLRSRLLIRRIVFRRRCVNTHGATVNRGEIVSMYAGLYTNMQHIQRILDIYSAFV